MAVNKVVFGNETLIDISKDTVTKDKLLEGFTAHDQDGNPITGECNYDAYTGDATATEDEILATKTAYRNGSKLTGTMPNKGSQTYVITKASEPVVIDRGYHDGGGTATVDMTNLSKENIKQGVTILGVEGEMTGTEDVNAQSITVTPKVTGYTVGPDTANGYNFISEVHVDPIEKTESTTPGTNGTTVTIGQV